MENVIQIIQHIKSPDFFAEGMMLSGDNSMNTRLRSLSQSVKAFENETSIKIGVELLQTPQTSSSEAISAFLVATAACRTGDRVRLTEMQARLQSLGKPFAPAAVKVSLMLAALLENMGDLDMSWRVCESGCTKSSEPLFQAAVLIQKASLKSRHGDREHSRAMLTEAENITVKYKIPAVVDSLNTDADSDTFELFRQPDPAELLFRIWLARGVDIMRTGNHPGAYATITRAMGGSNPDPHSIYLAEGYRYQGIIKSASGEFQEAMEAFSMALAIFKTCGDLPRMARLHSSIGRTFLDAGNSEKGSVYFHKALALARKLSMLQTCAEVNSMLGHIAMRREDYPQALAYYRDDLRISRGLGNPHAMAHVHHNLGRALRYMGELDEARSELNAALQLFTDVGDARSSATVLLRIGDIAVEQERPDDAEEHLRNAIEILGDTGGIQREGMIPFIMGRIDVLKGMNDQALEHFEKAEAIFMERGLFIPVVEVSHHIALLLAENHEPRQAVMKLNKALKIAQHNRLEKALGRIGDHLDQLENCGDGLSILPEKIIREMVRDKLRDLSEISKLPEQFNGLALCIKILSLPDSDLFSHWNSWTSEIDNIVCQMEKSARKLGFICSWKSPQERLLVMPLKQDQDIPPETAVNIIAAISDIVQETRDFKSNIGCGLCGGKVFNLHDASHGSPQSRFISGPAVAAARKITGSPGICCEDNSFLKSHLIQEGGIRKWPVKAGNPTILNWSDSEQKKI
ncbi:MAG: hypothetical protein CVV64_10550 [Candidatus Wallbacteria bacterium HGW-Wallbacteria-1]|jgi:tetratricopeptide (TPR) repeat protein|uniref:Uncharacterized protein n=1 Tax=Candidatus Wallbacteria bacterium HGW-Wallbacteria-1 TaxID=2013854 RepID=A0A2N1PPA2_9BACT|nr:MAG: hypothetical protein CVV64_10550 [Candidatus Wallbacteria bacterium HGW-Wallbacteria-1]